MRPPLRPVPPTAGLTPEGVHQAFHAQLMLHSQIAREAGVPLASLSEDQLPCLPEALAGLARHMWLASAVDVHVSKLQTDVSGALAVAGIPNTIEWLTDDGLFSIDIAFEVRGLGQGCSECKALAGGWSLITQSQCCSLGSGLLATAIAHSRC